MTDLDRLIAEADPDGKLEKVREYMAHRFGMAGIKSEHDADEIMAFGQSILKPANAALAEALHTIKWLAKERNADFAKWTDAEAVIERQGKELGEKDKALDVVREVAERITKEGTDAPLDPLWLYERMCEVIEVIDAAHDFQHVTEGGTREPYPGVAAADAAIAALEAENERLRVAITKLYRSPLLDESGYHERGEDIPEDVWDACEVIRQVLTPRPTEGGDRG